MQDNYEEDLSEKEKAIVREMCNVRMISVILALSFVFFCCKHGGLLVCIQTQFDTRAKGTRGGLGSAVACFGCQ